MELEEWKRYINEADEQMKKSNGHDFVQILKTRCQNCGKSPGVKTKCGRWFQTFIARLTEILVREKVIKVKKYY